MTRKTTLKETWHEERMNGMWVWKCQKEQLVGGPLGWHMLGTQRFSAIHGHICVLFSRHSCGEIKDSKEKPGGAQSVARLGGKSLPKWYIQNSTDMVTPVAGTLGIRGGCWLTPFPPCHAQPEQHICARECEYAGVRA